MILALWDSMMKESKNHRGLGQSARRLLRWSNGWQHRLLYKEALRHSYIKPSSKTKTFFLIEKLVKTRDDILKRAEAGRQRSFSLFRSSKLPQSNLLVHQVRVLGNPYFDLSSVSYEQTIVHVSLLIVPHNFDLGKPSQGSLSCSWHPRKLKMTRS